jgi:hypothetical protein
MHTFNKAKLKALGDTGCLQPGPTYGPEHRIVVLTAGDPPDTPDESKKADTLAGELRDIAEALRKASGMHAEQADRLLALAQKVETEPLQDK